MGIRRFRGMSVYVVMGVSGSGKTTVAEALAKKFDGLYLDADDFHPAANKAKMAAAIPLTDDDRWPWLDTLNTELQRHAKDKRCVFLACSALRQIYRDRLARNLDGLQFIYLKGSKECIRERMEARKDHFMPAALLDSQFAVLEEPRDAIVVSIADSLPHIIDKLSAQIAR